MTDHDDEIDVGDNDEIDDDERVSVDPVAAAVAFTNLVAEFSKAHKLVTTDKAKQAALRAVAKLKRQAADAVATRDEARREAAAIVEAAQAEVKAIQAAAQQRLEAAEAAEQGLVEREQKIARLEAAWRNLGEPETVLRGFQSPQYSPLQKARMGHGLPAGKDPNHLLFSESGAAPDQDIDAYIRRDVGEARSDAQGNAFAPSSLTRSTEHKRGAA
jgi:hypothetical protein